MYIERSLSRTSLIFDIIQRISKHVNAHTLAIQVGRFPRLEHSKVTSISTPFFPKLEFVKGSLFTYSAVRAYKKLTETLSFDIVHAHFAYPEGFAAQKISSRFNIPYVVSIRGDDALIYPYENNYLFKSVSSVLRNCNGLIAVSKHLKDQAIKLGAHPERCVFHPDGVPTEIFNWSPEDELQRQPNQVLYAGSLIPRKNVIRMIEAMAKVIELRPQLQFYIAGEGPLENEVRRKISKLKIDKNCKFLCNLRHSKLVKAMKQASVLILPSHIEGWPNVIVEAMSCGTPVVASRVCGIPEQIADDSFGLLFDQNCTEDIASKIVNALEIEWNHEIIAARGGTYSRDNTANCSIELYKKILNQ